MASPLRHDFQNGDVAPAYLQNLLALKENVGAAAAKAMAGRVYFMDVFAAVDLKYIEVPLFVSKLIAFDNAVAEETLHPFIRLNGTPIVFMFAGHFVEIRLQHREPLRDMRQLKVEDECRDKAEDKSRQLQMERDADEGKTESDCRQDVFRQQSVVAFDSAQ